MICHITEVLAVSIPLLLSIGAAIAFHVLEVSDGGSTCMEGGWVWRQFLPVLSTYCGPECGSDVSTLRCAAKKTTSWGQPGNSCVWRVMAFLSYTLFGTHFCNMRLVHMTRSPGSPSILPRCPCFKRHASASAALDDLHQFLCKLFPCTLPNSELADQRKIVS